MKKTITSKKLRIARTTLRELTTLQLEPVVGGQTARTTCSVLCSDPVCVLATQGCAG